MIKKLSLARVAMAIFSMFCSTAFALEVPVVADTYTNPGTPTISAGSSAVLRVGIGQISYMKFDFSTLPAGALGSRVAKASLLVWVGRIDTAGRVEVLPVTTPWMESSLTASTPPGTGAAMASAPVETPAGYITVDVTELVKSWIEYPGLNFGLALASAPAHPTMVVQFSSKEDSVVSHAAKLEVVLLSDGVPGTTGPVGPAGAVGPQGSPGIKGDKGEAGAAGATGPAGAAGPIGQAGAAGSPGAAGATGPAGPAGAVGPVGPAGASGLAGAAGAPGITGAKGDKGDSGTGAVPVVAEMSVCDGAVETLGITADRKALLFCQDGVWRR